MHDDKTTRGYKLPHRDNELSVDVDRLRETINSIDTDIDALTKAKPDGATTASPGIVKLASDDEVSGATGDGVITAKQSGLIKPKTATVPEGGFSEDTPPNFDDTESLVSPAYLHNVFLWLNKGKAPDIIGVALTGEYDIHGAKLAWINDKYEEVEDVVSDYFDKHPAFQFTDTFFGLNEFVRIPLAYWKRGNIPSGPFSGRWGMMLSTEARDGFKSNHVAFKRNGILQDELYWGKYRASGKASGVPVVQSGNMNAVWKDDTFDNCVAACKKLGAGFHLGTAQEYSEILARAVIERKTFDLWPRDKRTDYDANIYRGIHEMAYDGTTNGVSTSTNWEWRDGIRIKQKSSSSDTPYVQVYDNNGTFSWVTTTTVGQVKDVAPTEFISDEWFDNLFIAKQETGLAIDNSTNLPSETRRVIIPDRTYLNAGNTSYPYVAYSYFNAGFVYYGAFSLLVYYSPSSSYSGGFRVAK